MAQASKRSAFLRPVMYDDDEPSSISMSLELFGYHNGGDEAADGSGSASALSLQLAFDDDSFVKGGCECDDAGGGASAADYYYYGSWAAYGGSGATSSGSNSSVLSFEQAGSGGQRHHLVYGEDGCALWMDDAGAGMVVEHPPPAQQQQQHGSGCDFGLIGSSPDDAGLHIQLEPGTVQLPAKAPPHKRARRVRN